MILQNYIKKIPHHYQDIYIHKKKKHTILYLPKRIFTILQYHKTSYKIPINYKNPKWKNRKNDISQQLHRFISNKLHHFTQKSLTQRKNVIISMIYNKNIVFRHIVTAQNTNSITSKYGLLFSYFTIYRLIALFHTSHKQKQNFG